MKNINNEGNITVNFPPLKELINDKFIPYFYNNDKFLILYGSRGSSKSDFASKIIIYRMLQHKYFRCLSIRETQESIKESSFTTLCDNIYKLGLSSLFKITVSPMKIQCVNSNYVIFRGMDEVSRLKSLNNITCIHYEEELPKTAEEWNTINLTMRSMQADFTQILCSINPTIADHTNHYFWKMFFENEDELSFRKEIKSEDTIQYASILHSTYLHNKWLSPDFIQQMEQLKLQDPYIYMTQALGRWSEREIKGRFYMSFSILRNTCKKEYNPNMALHISFDFNVLPYSALTVFQIYDKDIYQIDEFCIREEVIDPITAACRAFKSKYRNHIAGMFIYGDATGRSESSNTERGYNKFSPIIKELEMYHPSLRIPTVNPPVTMRGTFMNNIFSGCNEISINIGENCHNTITDFLNTKMKGNGDILKEMVTDKKKGESYEKYAHLSDSCFVGNTLIRTIDGNKRIEEIKIGDLVLTRNGYKKVVKTFNNGVKEVNTYRIGDIYITCTDTHEFYTEENGYKPIKELIQPNTFLIYNVKENIICKKKLSITKESTGQDIQNQKIEQVEFIILDGLNQINQKVLNLKEQDYIGLYGKKLMEKYHMDIVFTTEMKIHLTTIYQIWNVWQQQNICLYMRTLDQMKLKLKEWLGLLKPLNHQKNGINQMKEENGILNMQKKIKKSIKEIVIIVELITKDMELNTVPENVITNIKPDDLEKKIVYDIQIEDEHEYFANDILVHNCGYMVIECFRSEYEKFIRGGDSFKPVLIPRQVNKKNRY